MTGQQVREFRTRAGISAGVLAAVAGVDRSSLTLWELDQKLPSYRFERRVVEAMRDIERLQEAMRPLKLDLRNPVDIQGWLKQLDDGELLIHRAGQCGEAQITTEA